MKAIEEDNGYDKLILFPPPLNFLLLPLILVSFSRKLTKKMASMITYANFWFENIVLIILFLFYMIAHVPFVLVRIYYEILTKIDGLLYKLIYLSLWFLFGALYCLYVTLVDTCMFISILVLTNSKVYD